MAGKRTTVWAGWATRAEAEKAISAVRVKLGDLDAASVPPAAARHGLTVEVLLTRWLDDLHSRPWISPNTKEASTGIVRRLSRKLGHVLVEVLSIEHTTRHMTQRQIEDKVSDRTAHGELCMLRTAWRWGVAARLHKEPLHMPILRLSKVTRPRPDVAGAWKVYDALHDGPYPEWALRGFLLGLATGARTGEIFGAVIGDFDLAAGVWHIHRGKTGARGVALSAGAVAVLMPEVDGRPAEERFVGDVTRSTFCSAVARHIRRACREVGVQEFTMYGLRRLAVDEYHRSGCPATVAGTQLGYTAEVAARIYRQVRMDEQADVAARARLGTRPPCAALPKGVPAAPTPQPPSNPLAVPTGSPMQGKWRLNPGEIARLRRAERLRNRVKPDREMKLTWGGAR